MIFQGFRFTTDNTKLLPEVSLPEEKYFMLL